MNDFPCSHRSLSVRLVTFAWKNGARVTDVAVATSRMISNAVSNSTEENMASNADDTLNQQHGNRRSQGLSLSEKLARSHNCNLRHSFRCFDPIYTG